MRCSNFAVVLMMLTAQTMAQQTVGDATERLRALDDAEGQSVGTGFGSGVVVQAGDAESKATISVSNLFSRGQNTWRYRVAATAPFDREKSDTVDVGTLSGLSAGTSATAEYSWVNWPMVSSERSAAATEFCDRLIVQGIGYPLQQASALAGLNCSPDDLTPDRFVTAARSLTEARRACMEDPPDDPAAAALCRERLALPLPQSLERVELTALLRGAPHRLATLLRDALADISLWTVAISGNRQSIAFVSPAAPTQELKQDERGWGVSAAYTRLSGSLLWSVGYSHEQASEAADKVTVCSPIEATGSLSCSESSLGAPKETESELFFGEMRWILPANRLAMSPRVEFDAEESEWALRLPVYLVRNGEGAFTAGVVAGYTTKESETAFAIFVGKEFAFFD